MGRNFLWHICRSANYLLINFSDVINECRIMTKDEYPDNDFVFMQDSAPSHSAKATQNFLRDNTPDFISSQEWTSHSPDLTLLDYSVWDIVQKFVRDKWHDVNDQTVRKAILQWKKRLAAVAIRMEDVPIQHIFC